MCNPRERSKPSTSYAREGIQRVYLTVSNLLLLVLFLAIVPTALASSTWYVDGVNGSDSNDCKSPQTACKTIGHAISLASSGDSVMVAPATYTENLTVNFSLKLIGAGASTTIVDGGGVNIVVYLSNSSTHVALSNLTIRNGYAPLGGGILNDSATMTINNSNISGNIAEDPSDDYPAGGGIATFGTLTINNSAVSRNRTINGYDGSGDGIYNGGTLTINDSTLTENSGSNSYTYGGAIYNSGGTLVINRSTLNGNDAPNGCGGGIDNEQGTLTINNSTLSGNSASDDAAGGGICNESSGTVSINNTTLSGNSAAYGGGISSVGTVTLQNSIVASPKGVSNCAGTMTSNGYNLSSDNTCNFNNTGDLNNTKPLLGRLQHNGGQTQTRALLTGSPAIDAGNPKGCTDGEGHLLKTDQRGKPRPDKEDYGVGCDMGAYERQSD
jgi:predicted outer membrane repeat protein